eukprot:9137970-Pyramimonas_sp.AAC.1
MSVCAYVLPPRRKRRPGFAYPTVLPSRLLLQPPRGCNPRALAERAFAVLFSSAWQSPGGTLPH